VVRIEYDPGRSGHIALLHRRGASAAGETRVSAADGAILAEVEPTLPGGNTEARLKRNEVKAGWSYILAPDGLRAGDTVQSFRAGIPEGLVEGWVDPSKAADVVDSIHSTTTRALGLLRSITIKPGNVLPLSLIPPGTNIHNLSTSPDGRMQLCRSAGTFGQVVAHHNDDGHAVGGAEVLKLGGTMGDDGKRLKKAGTVLVKLQSGEVRRLDPTCVATIGMVSK
jgi:ribosomal protein L2